MTWKLTPMALALASGLVVAPVLVPAPAKAQTEGELAPYQGGSPYRRGWDRRGWDDDGWRRPPPPVYRAPPPYYDARPPIDAGPGCRIVYQRDNWGGMMTLRDCRVCEPVVVTDQWGNRYRENRCRTVRQRIG